MAAAPTACEICSGRRPRTLRPQRLQVRTCTSMRVTLGFTGGISVTNCSWTSSSPSSPPQNGQCGSVTGASRTASTELGRSRQWYLPYWPPGFRPGFLGFSLGSPLENGAAWRFASRCAASRRFLSPTILRSALSKDASSSSEYWRQRPHMGQFSASSRPSFFVISGLMPHLSAGAVRDLRPFFRNPWVRDG